MQPVDTHQSEDQAPHKLITSFNQKDRKGAQGGQISRFLNKGILVLVVGVLVGVSLALFRVHQPASASPSTDGVGNPVTTHVQADGLELVMHTTPGPYFLSELFIADLSLTNHTQTTFTLQGPAGAGPCGGALFLEMTGGTSPNYTLPVSASHPCPFMTTQLKPKETLTSHVFIPLTSSGEISLEAGAQFLRIQAVSGGQSLMNYSSPLDGHWPSIKIHVASHVPLNRKISLQQEGTQVRINAPAAAYSHLYYLYNVSCSAYQGGTVGTGNFAWEPIATTLLQQPDCGDYGKQNSHWSYAVSSPGYAIASGQHPAR